MPDAVLTQSGNGNTMNIPTTHSTRNNRTLTFPAERARIDAGLSLEDAAKRLNLAPRYLRSIERQGNASIKTARRLARLYGCSGNFFIFSPEYFSTGQGQLPTLNANSPRGADTLAPVRAARRYRTPKQPVLSIVPPSQSGVAL